MQWALTPIDFEIAPPKPKRRHRDNRISAADIPLNAKIIRFQSVMASWLGSFPYHNENQSSGAI